jgi:hypothetical protein
MASARPRSTTIPMRIVAWAAIFCGPACAQSVVPPGQLPTLLARFQPRADQQPLRCTAVSIPPALNFAFRFQTGYAFRVSSTQYQGSNHTWSALTRITPDGGNRQPVYLFARSRPADVVKVDLDFEIGGGFLLGEGGYEVESTLRDDQNRACKREWHVDVKRSHNERAVRPSLPPFTVREFNSRLPNPAQPESKGKSPRHLTILLDAAPLTPRRSTLRLFDRQILLAELVALVERVPANAIRLVVFSLDQQKELLREDRFTLEMLDRVSQAMTGVELASVNVAVLQKPLGEVDLLVSLMQQELASAGASDTVVFLGPLSRYRDKLPVDLLPSSSRPTPHLFYVQYKPPPRRPLMAEDDIAADQPALSEPAPPSGPTNSPGGRMGGSPPPDGLPPPPRNMHTMPAPPAPSMQSDTDIINSFVARLRGRSLVVHTPVEFARAIEQLQRK